MEYIEGNYYELIKGSKNYPIRFVKNLQNGRYKYHDIIADKTITIFFDGEDVCKIDDKNEIKYSKTIPFRRLAITICRISELKNLTDGDNIFSTFSKKMENEYNTSVILYQEKDSSYYIETSIGKTKIENDINDYFKKIEKSIKNLILSQKVKDQFIKECFS
jgi:hypothetical protein